MTISEYQQPIILNQSLLTVAEKIDAGVRDLDTWNPALEPLWQKPLLLEAYLTMLRQPTELHCGNFKIISQLLSPQFLRSAIAMGALPQESPAYGEDIDFLPMDDI